MARAAKGGPLANSVVDERRKRIEQMLSFYGGVIERHLLDRGEWFQWSKVSPRGYGVAGNCYANAGRIALFYEGYTYYEGYAVTSIGFPVRHAWLVDGEGVVHEVTWRHLTNECGFCEATGEITDEDGDTETCRFCAGRGYDDDLVEDRTNTVYLGVPVERELLRDTTMEKGTWGVFDSRSWLATLAHDVCYDEGTTTEEEM